MEEILEKLSENSVSDGSNSPNSSQFSHYYKSGPTVNDQQKRRETILKDLKKYVYLNLLDFCFFQLYILLISRKRELSFDKNRHIAKEKNERDEEAMEWKNNHSTKVFSLF